MRFTFILFLLIFVSCDQSAPTSTRPTYNTSSSLSEALEIEFAQNLRIATTANGYIVHLLDPNTGDLEKEFTIDTSKQRKIISLTSTLNGMLSILESTDLLVGISNIQYIHDEQIKQRFNQGLINEFGDESNHSPEKIIASSANTILYSGFGSEFPNHEKLEKIGFEIIPIYDWREQHPLGKAEWIKLIGILSGKEEEALQHFEHVKHSYQETKQLVSEHLQGRPTVISGNLMGDIWYAPAGESFVAKLIHDAGGNYTYKESKGTGSGQYSMEQILKDNQNTEIWINPGSPTLEKIDRINPHAKHLKAYSNTYCYSHSGNLFWERSAAEPHLLLADLIHLFHPEIIEIQSFHFYKKVN